MPEIVIEISELKGKGDKTIKDLTKLLEEKLGGKIEAIGNQIVLGYKEEEKLPARTYVRVLIRKFLHKAELKEEFRVISGKENSFIIKQRQIGEEEE
jgi:hypothetical protein